MNKKRKDLVNNKYNYKHGGYRTRLYHIWDAMKQRCKNPKTINYKDYGGRGITICPKWAESYIVFRDWALSNGYQENLVIDRKDNDGNYFPENCHWITMKESNRKKRNMKIKSMEQADEIRYLHKTGNYTQRELAKNYGVSNQTINCIINNKIWV